jgi:hypothetical protein
VTTLGQVGRDPILERLQAQLVQAGDLGGERWFGREVGEGGAGPQRERIAQGRARAAGAPLRESCLVQEVFEACRVEIVLGDAQHVAGDAAFDVLGPDRFSKVRDVAVERPARRVRRILAPHLIDQGVCRYQLVHSNQEVRQHRSLLGASERNRAVVDRHLERAQDLEPHPRTVRSARPQGKIRPARKARPDSRSVHRSQPWTPSL